MPRELTADEEDSSEDAAAEAWANKYAESFAKEVRGYIGDPVRLAIAAKEAAMQVEALLVAEHLKILYPKD